MKPLQFIPLALAFATGLSQAGVAEIPSATTHVVAVGQALMEKAIRVRGSNATNADVQTVAQAFQQHGSQIWTLTEQQLTRDALKALLEDVGKAMKPQDALVFYFSGFSDQINGAPVLIVQGVGEKPDDLKYSSRQLPLTELQDWLAATGAPSLLMLLETGPNAPHFCAPWAKPGNVGAITAACADLPASRPGETGEFAQALAEGLTGPADANADHRFTGDELAAWLRTRLKGGTTVYQTGPVTTILKSSMEKFSADDAKALEQAAAALPAPDTRRDGAPVIPTDKLDALLHAIVDQSENTKAVTDLLEKDGIATADGLVPVQITMTNEEDMAKVSQLVKKLGGTVDTAIGKYLYARIVPATLKLLAESEEVWSMAAARPTMWPVR